MGRGVKIWTFLGVIIASAVAIGVCLPALTPHAAAPPAATDLFERGGVGVVDLNKLIGKHPDAQRLTDLDKQIDYLNRELDNGPDMSGLDTKARTDITKIRDARINEFKGEMARVQARMNAHKASVEGQLKAEAERLASEMKAYQKTLSSELPRAPRPTSRELNAKSRSHLQDLMLARDAAIAKRRLELQHQVEDALLSQKRDLDGQVNRRMQEVLKSHQAEKLQIQLDMQTATDEAERKKLQDRLAGLNAQEEEKRASVRKELSAQFDAARREQTKKADADLRRYRDKLDADLRRQAQEIAGAPSAPNGPPPDIATINRKLQAKQAELKSRFEARKNALMGELQRESEAAQAELKMRQKELEKKLTDEQRRILQDLVKEGRQRQKDDEARRTHLKSELASLKAQREKIYDGIVDQIRVDVGRVAQDRKVPLVLADYRVNVKCPDLTDAALQAVARK